jgi:hypothetical protein
MMKDCHDVERLANQWSLVSEVTTFLIIQFCWGARGIVVG